MAENIYRRSKSLISKVLIEFLKVIFFLLMLQAMMIKQRLSFLSDVSTCVKEVFRRQVMSMLRLSSKCVIFWTLKMHASAMNLYILRNEYEFKIALMKHFQTVFSTAPAAIGIRYLCLYCRTVFNVFLIFIEFRYHRASLQVKLFLNDFLKSIHFIFIHAMTGLGYISSCHSTKNGRVEKPKGLSPVSTVNQGGRAIKGRNLAL